MSYGSVKKVGWVILIAILSFTCTLHYIYQISLYKSTPYRNHANFQHLGDCVSLSTFNLDGTYDPMLSTLSNWNLYWKWYLETQAVISVFLFSFSPVTIHKLYSYCVGVLQVVHRELFWSNIAIHTH